MNLTQCHIVIDADHERNEPRCRPDECPGHSDGRCRLLYDDEVWRLNGIRGGVFFLEEGPQQGCQLFQCADCERYVSWCYGGDGELCNSCWYRCHLFATDIAKHTKLSRLSPESRRELAATRIGASTT